MTPFREFTYRLKILVSKHPMLISNTLSNIFTMRLIGNKTHGDLAEIAISEFINQYMYDFRSKHVGKDLFRSKSHEEDIKIKNEVTGYEFPVSLKAYGIGPLQLSTDKETRMFPRLEREDAEVTGSKEIQAIFDDPAFSLMHSLNLLPLIYDESKKRCNILIFDYNRARERTHRISREDTGSRRIHPVYKFYDKDGGYICEVRYGGAQANALQRGLWSHTKRGLNYFDSVTQGWVDYSDNLALVKLFSQALVASSTGHSSALKRIQEDILRLKEPNG